MAGDKIFLKNGTILGHTDDDNHVKVLRNTDLLIEGNTIAQIGENLQPVGDALNMRVIDCTDKIVSPGFTNTHAHLWQTPLKGRHADENLLDYFISGDIQHNHFTTEDLFWSQLAGAMESVDCGTTFVLDHSHCNRDEETAERLLQAMAASGIRCVFGYSPPNTQLSKWDMDEIVVKDPPANPSSYLDHIVKLAQGQPLGDGRVEVGLAFDAFYLPEDMVKGAFDKVIRGGVKVVTSHVVRVGIFGGGHSFLGPIMSYGLDKTTPHLVLSHCTNLTSSDLALLKQTQLPISSTPESEAAMGHGSPVLLEPGLNTSVGVDCHTANTPFIPANARTGLYVDRARTNAALLAQNKFPGVLRGSTEELFHKMTIAGARAVGMADTIGSLRVGKRADIVVFDCLDSTAMSCVAASDPLAAVVRFSGVHDVETVIIDGIVRKDGGKLCPITVPGQQLEELDWRGVQANLMRSAQDIWARDAKSSHKLARELVVKRIGADESVVVNVD